VWKEVVNICQSITSRYDIDIPEAIKALPLLAPIQSIA
jgi:hypothetical protein